MTTGNDIIKPRTRLAKFLAKIAGAYSGSIEPRTEVERYLDQIAEKGGGGGGDGGSAFYIIETEGDTVTTLDKNWHEIQEAINNNKICAVRRDVMFFYLYSIFFDERTNRYTVVFNVSNATQVRYVASSEDGVLTLVTANQ